MMNFSEFLNIFFVFLSNFKYSTKCFDENQGVSGQVSHKMCFKLSRDIPTSYKCPKLLIHREQERDYPNKLVLSFLKKNPNMMLSIDILF